MTPLMPNVNDADLFYVEQGNGFPLVFVHGSLGDYRTFESQFEDFSRHFRIIAYSRRFHPPNAWPPGENIYSALLHGDDLALFLQRLGVRSIHVVASSYGAYSALLMALRHRNMVRSLVLGEPPILPMLQWTSRGKELAEAFARVIASARHAFSRDDHENGLRFFFDGIRGSEGSFDRLPPDARVQLMTYAREMQCELLTPEEQYLPVLNREQLQGLAIPTLLVTGQQSPEMFHVISSEIEKCLPSVKHIEIPDAGHAMHKANPTFYNKEVLAFLAKY